MSLAHWHTGLMTWLAPAFTSSDRTVRVSIAATPQDLTISLTGGHSGGARYWGYGGGTTTLGAALKTAIETHSTAPGVSVAYVYSLPGSPLLRLTSDAATTLLWTHVNTTVDPRLWGHDPTADTASALVLDADWNGLGYWRPGQAGLRLRDDYTPVSYGARSPVSPSSHTRVRWHADGEGIRSWIVEFDAVSQAWLSSVWAADTSWATVAGRDVSDAQCLLERLLDAVAADEEIRLYITPDAYVPCIVDAQGPLSLRDVAVPGSIPGTSTVRLRLVQIGAQVTDSPSKA